MGDERQLEAVRRALKWGIESQYIGDDPEAYGSIVGLSAFSGLGTDYCAWARISCTYTSAFFRLVALEEIAFEHVMNSSRDD